MAEIMLDRKAAGKLRAFPIRISVMSADNIHQLVNRLKINQSFQSKLQNQLSFGRFILCPSWGTMMKVILMKTFLFCIQIELKTNETLFNVVNNFFTEQMLSWKCCISVCTDPAPSMTGKVKGLVARIKKERSWCRVDSLHHSLRIISIQENEFRTARDTVWCLQNNKLYKVKVTKNQAVSQTMWKHLVWAQSYYCIYIGALAVAWD